MQNKSVMNYHYELENMLSTVEILLSQLKIVYNPLKESKIKSSSGKLLCTNAIAVKSWMYEELQF